MKKITSYKSMIYGGDLAINNKDKINDTKNNVDNE